MIAPRPSLLVVGGGHVAMPVAEIGHLCGFRVVVLDDRPDMVSEARFPHADERISGEIVAKLKELERQSRVKIQYRPEIQGNRALKINKLPDLGC